MNRVRPYIPLIGFVVPTVIVGYGVVIPRSCIAGVNELTIGFGTTILGVIFTYIAGQRAVLPSCAGATPPLHVRVARALNRQAAAPRGWFGRILGMIWRREHARLNAEVLDLLEVREGHRVLEVGSGPGEALAKAAQRAQRGGVVGIDISDVMVSLARRRNRRAVAQGEVELRVGDIASLAVQASSVDRIFSVHSIYFWRDPNAVLAKLAHALKPGGRLVLAFRPEGDDIPARFRDPTYRFPRVEAVATALRAAGLVAHAIERCATSPGVVMVCASRS